MRKGFLVDIGGTYIRLAVPGGSGPECIEKYAAAGFSCLEEALEQYGCRHGIEKGSLYIATAAWPHSDGIWRFAREGRWDIDPSVLGKAGWPVAFIGNDFAAGARGSLSLPPEYLRKIREKKETDMPCDRIAVLGSGTGLGLAYVDAGDRIHETYGGHMDIPQRTDEQHMIVKLVGRLKGNDRPVSAEDVLSGSGLALLYAAVCLIHGYESVDAEPEEILRKRESPLCVQALRLFHEFLGMFAHQAVIYGHAYAGLFLDGGVVHRLAGAELFNAEIFLSFLTGDPLPLIKAQIEAMPVNIVLDPYATLRGLAVMVTNNET